MKKGSPILLYVMLFLVFISVFRLFSEPRTEEIPYSTFKALVTEHKVKDVVISQDAIKGVRSADKAGEKDKPFTVVRVDDPGEAAKVRESSSDHELRLFRVTTFDGLLEEQ